MDKKELLELNDVITDLEDNYISAKLDYELTKANYQIGIDWSNVLGKAKPTVAEKEAWIKLECKDSEENYKLIGVELASKKRQLEILLRFVGGE